jgi:hypothetical protein
MTVDQIQALIRATANSLQAFTDASRNELHTLSAGQ